MKTQLSLEQTIESLIKIHECFSFVLSWHPSLWIAKLAPQASQKLSFTSTW